MTLDIRMGTDIVVIKWSSLLLNLVYTFKMQLLAEIATINFFIVSLLFELLFKNDVTAL